MSRQNRIISAILVLCSVYGYTSAEDKPVCFNQSDGIVRQISTNDVSEITFSEDVSLGVFSFNGYGTASYALNSLESLTFETPSGSDVYDFSNPDELSVSFDESDSDYITNQTEEIISDDSDFSENYTSKYTVTINYDGSTASYSGSVAGVTVSIEGAHVTVISATARVCYVLNGSTSDGSFKITSDKKFHLKLNGVSITNPNGAAINIQSGKSVYVYAVSGTENNLCDGSSYTYVSGEDMKGTFFSEGQLIFEGDGTLVVKSLAAHAICSDDYVRFRSGLGTVSLTAAKDGINAKDMFLMYGGDVTINAGDDGINARAGHIDVEGGELYITAVDNALSASYSTNDTTYIKIGGGMLNLNTTEEKGHAVYTTGALDITDAVVWIKTQGNASKGINSTGVTTISDSYLTIQTEGGTVYDSDEADYSSAAGVRYRSTLTITDSKIKVKSTGDGGKGINGDAALTMSGSDVTVVTTGAKAGDDSDTVKPRGIDAYSMIVSDGSALSVDASHNAIHTEDSITLTDGQLLLFTRSSSLKCLNSGSTVQTGGLIYTISAD